MSKKYSKKKSIFVVLVLVLLQCAMAFPSGAVEDIYRRTDLIETEFGAVEVETVLTVHESLTRSNTKSANYAQTFKYSGQTIAEVTLFATFGYDGKTSWVTSASSSHTTYDGWSYTNEKISKSGGTASLSAKLSHNIHGSVAVNISLTCSPTGQIS